MKSQTIVAALISLALLPQVADRSARAATSVSTPPAAAVSARASIRAAHFAEPLVATKPTTPSEDLALSRAIAAYEQRIKSDDVSALSLFLSAHPHSGWTAALSTNLGLSYLHDGYFSRAIDAWKMAWSEGKQATDPHARALVDGAVGDLAHLYASLGHMDSLASLFADIGHRPVSGSATEAVQTAQEQLTLLRKDPRHLFLCGPMALSALLTAQGDTFQQVSFLQAYRAGPNGTSLAEVAHLADEAKFAYRLVFRKPGQPVPVPSIVHWSVGHFAAITGKANGRFHVVDPVFAGDGLYVTPSALDAEASGYFLVPADAPNNGWRTVGAAEAGTVWGKGPTNGSRPGDAGDPPANLPGDSPGSSPAGPGSVPGVGPGGLPGDLPGGSPGAGLPGGAPGDAPGVPPTPPGPCGMCTYNIAESSVAVTLSDSPVGYAPPVGPSARVRISYNQREASQPQNFNFFNVSPKWTLNWLTYVTDDPVNPGATVSRYLSGGGAFSYTGYNSATGQFAAQDDDASILVLASQSPVTYQRLLRDGSIEVYAQSNGATTYPRNVFLSRVIDPQGNALTLNYDNQQRLVSLTDATGRQTTFGYGLATAPLLVTEITDPFGRSASLSYDVYGRLSTITDVIGLTSSFAYDANSLVDALTTPYGTTNFAYTAPGTSAPPRFVQATDPLGYNEREEWLEPAPISDSDAPASVPQGMPETLTNEYLSYRDSFHWDKNAYIVAGCTPSGGCDYTKARDRHFNHVPPNTNLKSTSVESVKYALENRIWYTYPGQPSSIFGGTYDQPSAVGRVLDDGTTQLSQFTYSSAAFFDLIETIDPIGRTTHFTYALNQIDLLAITQTTADGTLTPLVQFTYNNQHRPLAATDAAGETTLFTYNAAGQLASLTNPLSQTTTYQYNASGDLTAIINANGVTAASLTYDAFDRVATYTDSEGWTASYSYDNANRVTAITYPDGTSDHYTYNNLDLASYQDRQGRLWTYTHDADRRLTQIIDPLGNQTVLAYNGDGELTSLIDPKGNTTSWTYDIEGRLTTKQYADNSTVNYTYENTTSRLKTVTDALGQTKQYSYTEDNRVAGVSYANAVNPTPNVTFVYDPYFPRVASMTDGNGTTQYSYVGGFALGALQLQQECFEPTGTSSCSYQTTYAYDGLGRTSARNVAGAGPETFQYDAIGRLTNHANDLGAFALSYLGQTAQITQRQLAGANVATTWSYRPNAGDRRLASINNVGLSTGQFSIYQFTTTPENFISAIGETSDSATAYPSPSTQTASYNDLNQLTNLSGQALSFDANGNVLSDGQRNYAWDAENRLVGITYPAQAGKQTAFTYDGLSRRVAITSTPAGGSAVTTSYIWCGSRICQARNASNATTREYYSEGEFVPGTPAQPLYYGVDQIGSVRRVFASTSAPAFSYDPYGNALQTTAPVTDFGYAHMFYNADSGLSLTQYRAYDPVSGRWLSRDPLGEGGDPAANLYRYVRGDPLSLRDPSGLQGIPDPNGVVPGGPWSPAGPGQRPGAFYGPPQPSGPRDMCQWVPSEDNGGPPGSEGYWKSQSGGQTPWSRWDQDGNPITPEEAHPSPYVIPPPVPPIARSLSVFVFLGTLLHSDPAY